MSKKRTRYSLVLLIGVSALTSNISLALCPPGFPEPAPIISEGQTNAYRILHLVVREKNMISININSDKELKDVQIMAIDATGNNIDIKVDIGYTQSKNIGKYDIHTHANIDAISKLKVTINGEIFYHNIKEQQHENY